VPGDAVVIKAGTHTAFPAGWLPALQSRIVDRVRRFHAEAGNASGMQVAALHADVARAIPLDVFTAALKLVATRAGLRVQGSLVNLAAHDSTDNPRDRQTWERMRPVLLDAAAMIPSVRELSAELRLPLQQVRDLVHRKAKAGELVQLTPERFALPETIAMLREKAREVAAAKPEGFSAAQYRDAIGTGRGLAIEILECLDRLGATMRRSDLRIWRDAG
jgi:selenocysteine-specific elongation factor